MKPLGTNEMDMHVDLQGFVRAVNRLLCFAVADITSNLLIH